MSHLISFETVCTACKHPNQAEVWSAVNVKEDPELKDILLGGEFNMVECEACKEIFYAEHFLLYHDSAAELLAFVYPYENKEEREKWELKTQADFAQTQLTAAPDKRLTYEPISLFGLDELVFLLEAENEMEIQSEIAEVIAKDHDIKVQRFRPFVARAKKLPVVLPYIENGFNNRRDQVLAGLAKLKAANDRLSVFTKLEADLKADPSLNLESNS